MNCAERAAIFSLQGWARAARRASAASRHLDEQLAILYTQLTNEARQSELKLKCWAGCCVVNLLFRLSWGGWSSRISRMHFAKQIVAWGGIPSSLWEQK